MVIHHAMQSVFGPEGCPVASIGSLPAWCYEAWAWSVCVVALTAAFIVVIVTIAASSERSGMSLGNEAALCVPIAACMAVIGVGAVLCLGIALLQVAIPVVSVVGIARAVNRATSRGGA